MAKNVISTTNAPAAIGPYSQAIEVNGFLYASGQIPINPATGEIVEGIEAQTKQALTNVKGIVEAAGLTMSDIVKTSVFIKDMNDFGKINEIYATFFEEPYPRLGTVCPDLALPQPTRDGMAVVAREHHDL